MNNSLNSLIKTYFETDESTDYSSDGEWKIATGGNDLVAEIYHVEEEDEVPVCGIIDHYDGYDVQAYQNTDLCLNTRNDVISALRDIDMIVRSKSQFVQELKGFNRTNDKNGNAVLKAFYKNGTSEIIRGGRVNDFYIHYGVRSSDYNKRYDSESGLQKSHFDSKNTIER